MEVMEITEIVASELGHPKIVKRPNQIALRSYLFPISCFPLSETKSQSPKQFDCMVEETTHLMCQRY